MTCMNCSSTCDCAWVCRADLEPHIGEVATASVACGVMGYGGNKGAVAVSFSLFRRRMVIVSSHFAAHQVITYNYL
jgi:phosphatidylinositol-bisphosphatase